ncbi:ATP-dependent zinc metalloprotease FtsH [Candidatus Shapirobacteria bacterium]|nr:ATP-dependent zinc metalloprotease FtsH [Candidatus Shapirobacteria bacterium]
MSFFKKTQKEDVKNNTKKKKKKELPTPEIKLPEGVKKVEVKITPKKILSFLLGAFIVGWILLSFSNWAKSNLEIPLSRAIADIKEGKVKSVEVVGDKLSLVYNDGQVAIANKEPQQSLVNILQEEAIDPSSLDIKVIDQSFSQIWWDILLTIGSLVLMGVFFYFMFRQARGAQESIFSFGKSNAKPFIKGKQKVTFADVAGVEEAKQELKEVVDFLKNPQKYRRLGARTPKGVLLVGPPGTGKTLLARAVAGEANVPFFSMAGSEFMEMLVGVGSARMRDLFETAKKNAPSIIFIDEIESIGRARSLGGFSSHDEREQTLNQMLVEMDGFAPNDNVVVIGATNRPDLLDLALMRPGRFDRRVVLDMPDIEGRKAILKVHSRGKPFAKSVNWEQVAKQTVGFSGADLENMLNEAAILAAREEKTEIDTSDIEEAATKVKLGPQRKRLQSKEEKEMAAYHESGHALVAHFLPHMDSVGRISIVARGLTLGHTFVPPAHDRGQETKSRLLEQIVVMLGGRAAEEVVFKEITTGAADDIDKATSLARKMVVDLGMSDLGPISFGLQPVETDFGYFWPQEQSLSQEMQAEVDKRVKKIVDKAYEEAKKILAKNRSKLDKLAKTLLEKETLDQEEFEALMGKKKVK